MRRLNLKSFCSLCVVLALLGAAAGLAADEPGDWRDFIGPEKTALLESVRRWPAVFYVSPDGSDDWSGTLPAPNAEKSDGPLRSFEKARDAVREYRAADGFDGKPTVIEILPGLYELEKPLVLTAADSGTASSPVVWRGVCGENGAPLAEIRGGKTLTGGKKPEDPAVLKRLKPEAREKVLEFDLSACGIDDFGTYDGTDTAELFCGGDPMTIARYPNEGFMKFEKLAGDENAETVIGEARGDTVPRIIVEDYDIAPWAEEPEAWTHGYWYIDWANSRQKIVRVNAEKGMFELDKPYHGYGYRAGQYFYAYHLLCELDSPGEYYIDGGSGKLYFYPPEDAKEEDGAERELFLSTAPFLVQGSGLSHTVFSGLQFNGCRKDALQLGGNDLLLCGSLIRNAGGSAVSAGGDRIVIFGNHILNIGSVAVRAEAGDRTTLTPGKTAVINNDIHHFGRIVRAYASAVLLAGCGDLIAQNRLTDAPHAAILFSGNEQRIERNEIARVCQESNDAGAIYTGRDWTMRGNIIRQNYLHDISGFKDLGCVGVYLDDMFSSADVTENLFVRVTRAAMIGGGRDNRVTNNLFIDCEPNLHVDARALGWAHRCAEDWIQEFRDKGTVSGIDIKSDLWAERYPELAQIMERNPKAPEGNLIERNLMISTEKTGDSPHPFRGEYVEEGVDAFSTIRDNVEGDLRLLLDMTRGVYDRIPGTDVPFRRIPVEKIGLFEGCGAVSR